MPDNYSEIDRNNLESEHLKIEKESRSIQLEINELLKQQSETVEKIKKFDASRLDDVSKSYGKISKHAEKYQKTLIESSLLLRTAMAFPKSEQFKAAYDSSEQELGRISKLIEMEKGIIQFESQMAQSRYEKTHRWGIYIQSVLKDITGFNDVHINQFNKSLDILNKYPFELGKAAGVISAIVMVLKGGYDLFLKFDKAAFDFRKNLGMVRDVAIDIRKQAENIAINFMHVGVTIEMAYNSIVELGKEMGSVHIVTEQLTQTTAVMASQLGVAEATSATFLRTMAAISGTTMDVQKDLSFIAAKMSMAAGVPLDKVMKDVGSRSNEVLTMMSRLPLVVVKTSIELKKMNTSLQEAAKSSRQILDFSSNVQAEMEASVLLGRSVNLQLARELAYKRDLEGSTKEILRLTNEVNFENLDVFQQEAFAAATGKSVDELLRMVQAEKEWNKAKSDPRLASKIADYDKLRNINQEMLKDEGARLEQMVLMRSNQERITAITQKWNQIMAKAGEIFLPIIDGALGLVPPLMDVARLFFSWTSVLAPFIKTFANIVTWVMKFVPMVNSITVGIGLLAKNMGTFGGVFSTIIGGFSKFGIFFKWVPIIGWVITGMMLISDIIGRWKKIDWSKGIIDGLLQGVWSVVEGVAAALWEPFRLVLNWLGVDWLGKSPSGIGLSIVNGIVSVGAMLFDALTYPWRMAFSWITSHIPGMSKFSEQLAGGLTAQINSNGIDVTSSSKPEQQTATKTKADNTTDLLQTIAANIEKLNTNLESGKIRIYIDGNLLNSTMARNSEFFGGFGTNNVRA